MTEREKILGRIREALQIGAPAPGAHGNGSSHATFDPKISSPRRWLPPVGEGLDAHLALFAKNSAELKTDFQLLGSADEARQALVALRDKENWKRIALHSGARRAVMVR